MDAAMRTPRASGSERRRRPPEEDDVPAAHASRVPVVEHEGRWYTLH